LVKKKEILRIFPQPLAFGAKPRGILPSLPPRQKQDSCKNLEIPPAFVAGGIKIFEVA